MFLRAATRRTMHSGLRLGEQPPVKRVVQGYRNFSVSNFFEEKYFWTKANIGPFFLFLCCVPTLYRSFKDFYWTRQVAKLNTEEIIGDRYEWLRLNMLKDEVE